jgi:hypothetical protein
MAKLNTTRLFAFVSFLFLSASASAQLTGGSVFLKGKFVEAGICANGDFGAASPPAGYHPHGTPSLLGFVADPAMDGWATGTPAYTGDFFTPGSPFEGWNLQIGTARAQAQSCAGFSGASGLAGTNTAYVASGSKVIGTWTGSFDSLTITQETTLDTMALYFSMRITLTNTASTAKNDIYYLRSLDPDNDESWPGGSFSTKNKIEFQLPNASNSTVVSARGLGDTTSYLALGTTDSNAKCLIYSAWPISSTIDLSTIFSGTFGTAVYAADSVQTGDVAIGLAFHIAHLAALDSASDSVSNKTTNQAAIHKHPANQKSFTYYYAFSRNAVDSATKYLVDTMVHVADTTHTTTGVSNVNENDNITVYPNPAGNVVNITNLLMADEISLYDMMGRPAIEKNTITTSGLNSIPMQNLATGSYIMVVRDGSGHLKARIPIRKN